jgi:hypothetical protein
MLLGTSVGTVVTNGDYHIIHIRRGGGAGNARVSVTSQGAFSNSTAFFWCSASGIWQFAPLGTPALGVRFMMGSGNIARGTFKLYGIVK